MTTLSTQPAENIGGLQWIKWCEPSDVASVIVSADGVVTDFDFQSGKDWTDGYFTFESLGYSEVQKSSTAGEFYGHEVSGFIPGESSGLIIGIERMRNRRYLVTYLDFDGNQRICGTLDHPLRFRMEYGVPSKITGLKGTRLLFYGDTPLRSAPVGDAVLLGGGGGA